MKRTFLSGLLVGLIVAGVAVVVVLQVFPRGGTATDHDDRVNESQHGGPEARNGPLGKRPKEIPTDSAPEEVVRHLFACMRASDYEGLKSCHTSAAWQVVASMYEGMQNEVMGRRLRERMANVRVSIRSTDISGRRATVVTRIRDGDESTDETFSLVKTDKGWRVDYVPPLGARQVGMLPRSMRRSRLALDCVALMGGKLRDLINWHRERGRQI